MYPSKLCNKRVEFRTLQKRAETEAKRPSATLKKGGAEAESEIEKEEYLPAY